MYQALPWYEISDVTWISSMFSTTWRSLPEKSAVNFFSIVEYSFSNPIQEDKRRRDLVVGRMTLSND